MRAPFRIRPYDDTDRPALKFLCTYREGGKRKRRFFTTKKAAEGFGQTLKTQFQNQGREGVEFPSALRIMASQCAEILAPFGKTIQDATDHLVEYLKASAKSCTVNDLAEQLQAAKLADGASEAHLHDLKTRLRKFCADFGEQNAATITTAQIDDWLRGLALAPQSRNNYRTVLNNLFNFAVSRGYATTNPTARAAKAKVTRGAPEILTVTQAVALLNACEADTLPLIAISMFAGLRAAEMARLDWTEVDLDGMHIEMKSGKAKTGARRLVPISPNLAEWIRPLAKHSGPVVPHTEMALRLRLKAVRERAGLTTWPANCLRHSYASYRLAQCQDVARVALECGNSPTVIFQHYRELVKPKDAARFWKIAPSVKGAKKIVPMAG